jgi:hypothetical protein
MSHKRIPEDHPFVVEIAQRDPQVIPWVPHALAILAGLDERDEYSHTDFIAMCDAEQDDLYIHTAAMVISSWPGAILEMQSYTMHEGAKIYLPRDQMLAILKGQDVSHPVTGEPFVDADKNCYISYRIRDGL